MAKGKFLVLFLTLMLGIFTVAWADQLDVPSEAYPDIQTAITAASDYDVIQVAAGIYVESLQIIAPKQITIKGAGSADTVIQPAAGSNAITISALTTQSLTLQDIQLSVSGAGRGVSADVELSDSDLTLTNVVFNYGLTGRGVHYGNYDANTSTGNTITVTGSQINRVNADGTGNDRGIYFNGNSSTLSVTNSTITAGYYAIVMNGSLFTANITGSELKGFSALNLWTDGFTGNHSVINVASSTLTGRTFWGPVSNTYATIAFSGYYTTVNVTNSTLTNEWVGTATSFEGLALAYDYSVENVLKLDSNTQLINTNTVYAPLNILQDFADFKWYINDVLQVNPVEPAFFVNSSIGNDANSGEYPALAKLTIQAAIDAATAGDLIYVAAGTYAENVNVNKSVTINGAGQANTIVVPAVSNPGPADGGSLGYSNVFTIAASNVSISNLTVDGDNPNITSNVSVNGFDIDARNGIAENFSAGVWNNLHVSYVTVKNVFLRGINVVSGGTGFHIEYNTVQNVWGSTSSIGIFASGGTGIIEHNSVSLCNDGISANWSKGTQFLSNTVTNCQSGIHTDNNGGSGGVADLIQLNTVTNSTAGGYGIWVFNPILSPTVNSNTITNVDIALFHWVAAATTGTATFSNNSVNCQNKAGSMGIYLTTGDPAWNSYLGNANVQLSGNTVINSAYGMILEYAAGYSLSLTAGTGNSIDGSFTDLAVAGLGTLNATGLSGSDVYVFNPGKIQDGINLAAVSGTVKVSAGTYTENVVVNKLVSVKGPEARVKPVIDGGGAGTVVTITANGALLDGFQIQHSGTTQADAGVMIYGASNCTVQNNLVVNNANGIGVALGSANTVKNNAVNSNQLFGIVLIAADGNTVQTNTISTVGGVAGACDALILTNLSAFEGDVTNGSNGNFIKGNTITSGHDGIYFDEYCGGNFVTDANVVNSCVENALHMWRIGGQTITGNTFSNSKAGIRMRGSALNTITGNTITGNQKGMEAISSWQLGVWYSSAPNTITGNNFTLNAPINFDNHDNLQDQESETLNINAILANNSYDRSILVDQIIYRNAAILYVQAPRELIKDNDPQVYSVKVADVANLRGFTIQIKIPVADFYAPNINTDFALGAGYTGHTLPGFMAPVVDLGNIEGYYTYVVDGAYLMGGPTSGITGSDVELFKVNLTSLLDRDNIAVPGCYISLPLAAVLLKDAQNGPVVIPCAGTLPEFILIDATEPVFAAIPQIPGQPLPTFQDPVGAVDPTFLTLSVSDNYNLDYVMYLIQPAGTDPTTIAQFSSSVVSGITGAAWNNGGANWEIPNDVLNGLAQGEHEIFFLAVDDAGNFTISPSWNFIIDTLPPDPIVWWTEAQAVGDFSPCRTSVNANNSIDLKWTNPAGTVKVQIWRHCYGDDTTYPEYGLTGFTLPAAPNPYLASDPNGWVRLTNEVTGTTYTDTSMPRGYYYYTLFAEDASGNLSAAPAAPFYRESISYWPGDVEANYGAVDPDDIARLSVAWGATPTNGLPWNNLVDVGPSTDYARRSRPVPDNVINIHDMMMFAMNYNNTDYSLYYRQEEEETAPIAITLNAVQSGETLTLTLLLADNGGNLRGLNIPIRYGSGLSLQGYEAGEIWPETSLMLHTDADRVVTLSGAALGAEATVAGDGVIATVTFAITGADDSFELMRMLAFSEFNHEIEIVNNPTGNVDNDDLVNVIPESSYLGSSYPNPFRGSTTLTYGVKEAGGVRVTVFNSRGQLIRSLVNDSKAPGTYQIVWDGRDDSGQPASSGIYFFRLETKGLVKTHKALMLK